MSDERLLRDLRALDRAVDVDPAFGEALYAILEGERAGRRQLRPRLTLLLIAALLAALLVGGVVAVGSGPMRLPWTSDRAIVDPSVAGCPGDLPPGQLLELRVDDDGYADPTDEWGPTAGFVVRVYDDGLLLTAGHGRTVAQISDGDSGMTARRLSPTGIRRVLDAAERDALGSGCHDRWADIPERSLSVRGEDGGVARVAWGRGPGFIRQMTGEEQEAAERLVDGLRDPESWLPGEAWIDATMRPYLPDRWLVNIQFPPTYANPEGAPDRRMELPKADEMVVPDGGTLLALGDPYQESDGAAARGQPGFHGRCAVIGADAARSLGNAFVDAGAAPFNQNWWFRYESDALGVAIQPLLPTDEGCTPGALGLAEATDPSPTPFPQPADDLAMVDPCGLLSDVDVRSAIGVTTDQAIVITDQTARDGFDRLGRRFRACSYRLGEHWYDHASTVVYVRSRSTDVAQARVLAHEILGERAAEDVVADRLVWRNGCDIGRAAECAPAVAISVEPYFVVITFEGHREGDLPSIARALASAVRTGR